jgi:lauroyl/myristoyl acyltransferase
VKARVLDVVHDAVEWARKHVPTALLPLLVGARFLLAWSRSDVRRDAREQMGFLLEKSRPEADVEKIARAYVRRQTWRGELRWHPETITHFPVEGIEHLRVAQAGGHGVILNFMHHGTYEGSLASVGRLGAGSHMMVYPYMVRPDAPRWLKQHIHVACMGGGRAVSTEVGSQGILDLLRRGEVVAIASDVPGRTPLRFAGRDVLGSFGAARIAVDGGTQVVVMTSECDERGPFVRLHEPLDPADFENPQALLEEMLARHEAVVLRWPEETDLPLSRWGTQEVSQDAGRDVSRGTQP